MIVASEESEVDEESEEFEDDVFQGVHKQGEKTKTTEKSLPKGALGGLSTVLQTAGKQLHKEKEPEKPKPKPEEKSLKGSLGGLSNVLHEAGKQLNPAQNNQKQKPKEEFKNEIPVIAANSDEYTSYDEDEEDEDEEEMAIRGLLETLRGITDGPKLKIAYILFDYLGKHLVPLFTDYFSQRFLTISI